MKKTTKALKEIIEANLLETDGKRNAMAGVPSKVDRCFAKIYRKKANEIVRLNETPTLGPEIEAVLVANEDNLNLKETLKQNLSWVEVEASNKRVSLLMEGGWEDVGLDAAKTIEARNSLEKSLAHQMAATHATSMKPLNQAQKQIPNMGSTLNPDYANKRVEMTVKLVNASCRLMDTYQRAMQTLQKIRTGGKQIIQHQYVQVNSEGGADSICRKHKAKG